MSSTKDQLISLLNECRPSNVAADKNQFDVLLQVLKQQTGVKVNQHELRQKIDNLDEEIENQLEINDAMERHITESNNEITELKGELARLQDENSTQKRVNLARIDGMCLWFWTSNQGHDLIEFLSLIFPAIQEPFKENLLSYQNEFRLEVKQLQHRLKFKLKTRQDENIDGMWLLTFNFGENEPEDHENSQFVSIQFNDSEHRYTRKPT